MRTHTALCVAVAIALATGAVSAPAAAQTTQIWSPLDRSDEIIIGMASQPTSPGLVRAYACFDGPAAGDAIWYMLGNNLGLNADYLIHTEKQNSTATFFNRLTFVQYAGYQPGSGSNCASATGSWSPLLYNGHFIDAAGGGGVDYITAGQSDTILFGGAGDDYLLGMYSTNGQVHGEAGDDAIMGTRLSDSMSYGGADADCIEDRYPSSDPFWVADCGVGADFYGNASNAGMTSCESPYETCAFY